MSEDKFQESDFEKLIEDFLKEADQLEKSDLDFYEQFIGAIKKSFNKSKIEVNDKLACSYFLNSIALGFIYQKHGIENQLSSPALLSKFKPYLNLAGTKENINSLLALSPFEFREVSREFNSLCTKMFKKQSWVYKNYINLYLFDYCLGTSILLNIIRIDGFTKNTGISPDKYFKFAIEPMKVSNFLYSSLLSESSNVPIIKNHFSQVANQILIEIKKLCEGKTRDLFYPEDEKTHKKFVEDISQNKTEAEGLFNELVSEKFSGLKNINDILKYGFTPGKQLLSLSTKFRKQLLNKIESYYSKKGITVKRQRDIRKKMKNLSEYDPEEQEKIIYDPEEQEKIIKEYNYTFFKHEYSIPPTGSLSDDFFKEGVISNKERVISDKDVGYILSDPETMLELFYSSKEYDVKEILSEFTLNQSPALKKVGLFLLDDFDNYIYFNNGKFEISKIKEDSKLPQRNIERYISNFHNFVRQNYPELKDFNTQ